MLRLLLVAAIVLSAAPAAIAQFGAVGQFGNARGARAPAPQRVHPAVVRVVAPGDGTISFGSGTLVYVAEQYGLVVTNWHVVNEATGTISVHFPDGFYSLATVQRVDRDWDLAILAVRKPNVEPVRLAAEAPRPGDVLTIAGYGSGTYRAASGVCTQYVAPGITFPFEMVEVAVSARQGDSGGPIFNSRGELAGVLFGEGHGRTSGSYCGRVRWFLASVAPGSIDPPQQVAARPMAPVAPRPSDASASKAADAVAAAPVLPARAGARHTASTPLAAPTAVVASTRSTEPQAAHTHVIGWQDLAGETVGEQAKTVLAAIGVLAVILHLLKWMSAEPARK